MIAAWLLGLAQAAPPTVLYAASNPCANYRYPAIDGDWLIACDKRQQPTVRIDLHTMARADTDKPHRWPIAPALMPPPRAGTRVIQMAIGTVWVSDGQRDDADLWWRPGNIGQPRPLDSGPGDQHHPINSGAWLAWVSRGQIELWNTVTETRKTLPVHTGFYSAPTIDGGVLCWESRGPQDIDIICSDGLNVSRPGHQTHPLRWHDALFFREAGRLMVLRAEPKL
jgi:hypothetical protein